MWTFAAPGRLRSQRSGTRFARSSSSRGPWSTCWSPLAGRSPSSTRQWSIRCQTPHIPLQVLVGLVTSIVVAVAELYFLIRVI
ncbi:hypothetical protein MTO96_025807 [Rhipicephalus appendiculatus]